MLHYKDSGREASMRMELRACQALFQEGCDQQWIESIAKHILSSGLSCSLCASDQVGLLMLLPSMMQSQDP